MTLDIMFYGIVAVGAALAIGAFWRRIRWTWAD